MARNSADSRTLPPGDFDRRAETLLRFRNVRRVLYQQQLTFNVMQIWTGDLLSGLRDGSKSLLHHLKSFLGSSDFSEPGGQKRQMIQACGVPPLARKAEMPRRIPAMPSS